MADRPERSQDNPDELDLNEETIQDLDLEDDDASKIKGGQPLIARPKPQPTEAVGDQYCC